MVDKCDGDLGPLEGAHQAVSASMAENSLVSLWLGRMTH
jgi:hypothetical protein